MVAFSPVGDKIIPPRNPSWPASVMTLIKNTTNLFCLPIHYFTVADAGRLSAVLSLGQPPTLWLALITCSRHDKSCTHSAAYNKTTRSDPSFEATPLYSHRVCFSLKNQAQKVHLGFLNGQVVACTLLRDGQR